MKPDKDYRQTVLGFIMLLVVVTAAWILFWTHADYAARGKCNRHGFHLICRRVQ